MSILGRCAGTVVWQPTKRKELDARDLIVSALHVRVRCCGALDDRQRGCRMLRADSLQQSVLWRVRRCLGPGPALGCRQRMTARKEKQEQRMVVRRGWRAAWLKY